jgi:hypothetical protein
MDREAQRKRPEGKPSGWQRWRELLFLHWVVPQKTLRRVVPKEFELDTFEGQAFLGLVPFVMRDIRPWWLPGPMAMDFLETNVRTYVHYRGEPGVYFLSLDASSWLAVQAARYGWSLPYFHAAMELSEAAGLITYRTKRQRGPGTVSLSYRRGAPLGESRLGTLPYFLLERYYLFAQKGRSIMRGHVHHVPYPAYAAELVTYEGDLLGSLCSGLPQHAHYSPGVDVEVFGPTRL